MKKFFYLFLTIGLIGLFACEKDDDHNDDHDNTPDYQVMIHSPGSDDKHVGDSIHIHVEFNDAHEGIIHHTKVRIYKEDKPEEVIYEAPAEAHVHADKKYEHHDNLVLDASNGVEGHTDWVLEAKVWGHEAGAAEVVETVKFHVHP